MVLYQLPIKVDNNTKLQNFFLTVTQCIRENEGMQYEKESAPACKKKLTQKNYSTKRSSCYIVAYERSFSQSKRRYNQMRDNSKMVSVKVSKDDMRKFRLIEWIALYEDDESFLTFLENLQDVYDKKHRTARRKRTPEELIQRAEWLGIEVDSIAE